MAEWTQLHPETRETCASVSCGHSPASWRMDAGGTGSFFCNVCHDKIAGADHPAYIDTDVRRLHLRSSVLSIYAGASAMSYPVARDLLLLLGWSADEVAAKMRETDAMVAATNDGTCIKCGNDLDAMQGRHVCGGALNVTDSEPF